jgi:sortase A
MCCLLCFGFWQLGQGAYIPAKAWLAQELMQRAWRRAENGDEDLAPWPWADTWPIAKLSASDGEIELIVLAGSSGRTLAFGPGHVSASAMPGEVGNSVIGGHRDTHFQFLQHLQAGDSVLIETPDGYERHFRVTGTEVVDSRHGSFHIDAPQPMLSLVTCYPFDARSPGGPLRYVVTAQMVN